MYKSNYDNMEDFSLPNCFYSNPDWAWNTNFDAQLPLDISHEGQSTSPVINQYWSKSNNNNNTIGSCFGQFHSSSQQFNRSMIYQGQNIDVRPEHLFSNHAERIEPNNHLKITNPITNNYSNIPANDHFYSGPNISLSKDYFENELSNTSMSSAMNSNVSYSNLFHSEHQPRDYLHNQIQNVPLQQHNAKNLNIYSSNRLFEMPINTSQKFSIPFHPITNPENQSYANIPDLERIDKPGNYNVACYSKDTKIIINVSFQYGRRF